MTKTDPNATIGGVAASQPRRWLVRTAAVAYSASWIVGLFVALSSTDVTSSGSAIIGNDAPHADAVTVQFLLTEGLAAVALIVIVTGLWRATERGVLRSATLIAGGFACAISLAQAVLGVCLVEIAVRGSDASLASSLTVILNELDGVKMALLGVMAFAVSAAHWRRQLRLPVWLIPTGIATGLALIVSAIGYLTLSDALSVAAWVSLPLLLIYVTAVGLCVRPGSQR